jgi:bacterioferritin
MKGNPQVIDYLNRVLTNELTAINQYFMHYKLCESWGFSKLAGHNREESIEEMKHAEHLAERILFLEGLPNLQDMNKINVGQSVEEQLQLDLDLELAQSTLLREAIGFCRQEHDNVSKDLLQGMLEEEEEHIDWLETQLDLIRKIGIQNYLQAQL